MEAVHQFQGVSDSTMSHGEGWQFIQVGRYIERASAIGDAAGGIPRLTCLGAIRRQDARDEQ